MTEPITPVKLDLIDWGEKFQPETDPRDNDFVRLEPHDQAAMAKVDSADPARVWTMLDCGATDDDGEECWVLTNGKHFVNRLFYIICAVPVPEGEHYEISY